MGVRQSYQNPSGNYVETRLKNDAEVAKMGRKTCIDKLFSV